MTLRWKTMIIVGVTLAGLIGMVYATSQTILVSSFAELEEEDTRTNAKRAMNALNDEIAFLDTMTYDWAAWDDTYAFIKDRNDDYAQSNLIDETFTGLRLNLMMFIDASGQTVFGKAFDLDNEQEMPVPQSLQEHLSGDSLISRHADTESRIVGVANLPEGLMLVASRPILTSEEEGPIRGSVIFGRYLDASEIERLEDVTQLSLTVRQFNDPQGPSDFQAAHSSLSKEEPIHVRALSEQSIAGYVLVNDIYGDPSLVLRVDMPRAIQEQGKASVSYFVYSLVAVGVAFGAVNVLLLEKTVLSRLARLSGSVIRIGASGNVSARVTERGRDELARLASAINGMLEGLERAEVERKELARLATMGEVAMSVGHDLRNPLTGIRSAAYILRDKVGEEGRKMLEVIDHNVVRADRMILGLIDFSTETKLSISECDFDSFIEKVFSQTALPENVKIVTRYGVQDKARLDVKQVERVFGNLFTNAAEAMPEGGELAVSTRIADNFIETTIKDTGVGISRENIQKLFTPFFTTKAKGMGLGLINAKRTVEAHGGTVLVESEGEGKGTTVTMKLPVHPTISMKRRFETCED